MILFLNDWKSHPGAIVDVNTTNKSWLRLAGLLKSMGIKNHAFPLALHNPKLVGIDPHSDNLTKEQIIDITLETTTNPWYFFREVIRIQAKGSPTPIRITANRANISIWWLFFNHVTQLIIQSRQTGKTLSVNALNVYILCLAGINTVIHLLTRGDDLRTKTVQDIKDLIETLPWYFNLKNRSDTYNTEEVSINRLGNVYKTAVAQESIRRANNIARGFTIPIHHIDEFAFIKNIDISLPVVLASATQARTIAKENKSYYGNIFTTTAGYLSSPEGRFAYSVYKDCLKWNETLFDCTNEEDLYNKIKVNSPRGKSQVLCEYNHRQLGFTDEWLRETIDANMAEGIKVEVEYLNKWQEGNESSPISKEHLEIIKNSINKDPYIQVFSQGYIINWYLPEEESRKRNLVVGLDTSDAIGNDDIAMCIRDAYTGEVVGVGVFNETNILTFSEFLVDLLDQYSNIAVMIIERKSTGSSIIDNLIKLLPIRGLDPFRKLFNWVVNDAGENKHYVDEVLSKNISSRKEEAYIKYKKHFGYATSATGRSSRDNLYGAAFNASIKYTCKYVRDAVLARELSSLVRKNGRIDHPDDDRDDLVIAWLLPYFLLTQGKNLSYYGLDTKMVLSSVSNEMITEQGGIEAMVEKENSDKIMKDIYALLDRLKQERDPMLAQTIIARVKQLSTYVDNKYKVNFNLEAILDEIKLKKKKILM